MNKDEMKRLNLTSIEDFIDEDFGKVGTPQRVAFDSACDAFALGEKIKTMRNEAGLTQEELAEKIGTKKIRNLRDSPREEKIRKFENSGQRKKP